MKDTNKIKEQLTDKLEKMRQRIAVLEASESEQKQAEERIRQQNEFLNNVLDSLTYPFYVINVDDYTIRMANASARLDLSSEAPTCYSLTHKSDKPCRGVGHACPLEDVRRTKKPVVVEHIHYDKDGSVRDVEVHGYPLFDTEGNVIQIIEYCLDITERKQAEEEAEASKSKLQNTLENIADGVCVSNSQGEIIQVNEAFIKMHGYASPDEVIGKNLFNTFIAKEALPIITAQYKESVRKKQGIVRNLEGVNVRKDGSVFPVVSNITRLWDTKGNHTGNIAVVRDITERKRLELKLLEKNNQLVATSQAKSEFLASMSHELRTPLNAVIGFSELLLDGAPGEINDEQRECISDILESGEHLLNLINNVLDLSKIEAGMIELKLETLNLHGIINSVVQTMKPILSKNGHEIRVSIGEGLPQVHADKSRLRQILLNLLSNANKFTPPAGKLRIEVRREGDRCQVSVIDNGIGIKKEDQERIFQVFTQAETLSNGKKEGTGLGLSLTRKFVEVMGGRIWVESEYGKGSKFTFTLPLAGESKPYLEEKPEERLPEAVEPPPLKREQKRILIVDDDRKARSLFQAWLKGEGYATFEATGGDEGIRKAKELLPAVVVLDVLMPDKDGWQVLQKLKSMPETRDIPVVIASVVEEEELGFSLGAADYFVKPIDKKRFLKRIAELGIARRGKVLVVDDNPADVRLVASILEAKGIGVTCAYSGEEGVRMAKESEPALIVLDILMPDLNGFEVMERLHSDKKTRDIPIIILTVKELTEKESKLLRKQTKTILQKAAFKQEDFLAQVKKVINLSQK